MWVSRPGELNAIGVKKPIFLSLDFIVMGSVHITLSQSHDPQSLYTMQACEYCRIMYRVCTWSLGINPKVYDEHLSITVASWFNLCCRVSILLRGQQLNLSRWCSTVCCIGGGCECNVTWGCGCNGDH